MKNLLFTTQVEISTVPSVSLSNKRSGWQEIIGEKIVADAILDRLVHDAHRIGLLGESMRKARKIPYEIPAEVSD